MVATTNCRPVLVSSASDLLVRSATCAALRICASSTTRPLSFGKVCAEAGTASANSASHKTPRKRVTSAGGVEVYAGRILRRSRRLERDLRLGAVEYLGADRVGEGPDRGVILPNRLVVIAAGDLDAVFRAFELALKGQEVLVRLQVRIGFLQALERNDRLGQPALCLVERLHLGRVAEVA